MNTNFPTQLLDVSYYISEIKYEPSSYSECISSQWFSCNGVIRDMPDKYKSLLFEGPVVVGADSVIVPTPSDSGVSYLEFRFNFLSQTQAYIFKKIMNSVPRAEPGYPQNKIDEFTTSLKPAIPVGVEIVRAIIAHLDHDTNLVGQDEADLGAIVEKVIESHGYCKAMPACG